MELGPIVRDVQRAVAKLAERGPSDIGKIERSRMILNGLDRIGGTRIPTSTIRWFHENGYTTKEILAEFPRLIETDIEAAIAHEYELEAVRNAQAG
jgi:uncharacterized protein (DUF433 family)